ncbi:hypothetical protein A3Q56_05072 [Intoshia linei]|uniref:DUF4549 domain-containing protein n=1 Tax=Intoshia linei TaxID=1819745 RepID=A0A177B0E0_9BILA|nr:hypothetical protein A3Q56_05072 [Intoshia linei]
MTDNLMIKNLNIQLEHEIKQLNNYINGSTSLESHDSFKPSTSVRLPQSIDYYNKERKIFSEDKCNINHPKSINLQADMLHLEYVNIKKTDFNKQSMPSLILQHFEDKLYQICQAKLRCSIRWERYCKNSTLSSKMYPDYKKMMTLLLSEYDDTVVSLERLGSIREFCILEQYEKALNVINKNDLEIMEYLPYKYKNKLMKGLKTTSDNEIVLEKSDYSLSKDVQLNTRSVVPICVQNSVNYMMDLKYFCQHFDIKTNIIDEKLKMNTMEENILYGIVNKVFKRIFDKQKYRNTFEIYRVNGTNMNNDSSKTYLKINDWIAHSVIYPQRNLRANEEMLLDDNSDFCDDIGIKLICASLLADNSCAALKCIRKYEKLILQENGNNKKNKKPLLKDNQNNLSEHEMEKIWKNIYVDSDQVTKSNDDPTDNTKNKYYTMESLLNQLATDKYNYRDTVTNLGLDGMGQENIEYTSGSQSNSYSNGSYSSYFMLRYLYIRYLRRKTLSYLNYFRSIERSITISELGLALEGDAKNANVDKKKSDQSDATQENNIDENMNNFGNRLNSNKYIYSSPLEYKMNQVEFMEYESVKNHDDFHTKRDDGIINVIDSDGKIVMYDISLDDLKTVESQISKITSYYVNKNLLKCANLKEKKQTSLNQDRHLIIYDAWKSTCEYFEILQKLVYVYMFCYENIFDKNEKRNMAQTIITMIFKRIRYNLEDDYFLESVQLEIANIDNHIRLVQKVYERIIQNSRKYSKCIVSRGELKVGMYMYNTNDVFDISDHLNTGILTSTHLFEFNFMLAGLSRIYPATLQTFQKICNNSKSVNIDVRLETAIFEQVLLDFTNFNMCEFYDTFVIENIIDVPYIYDPHILVKIIKNLLSNFEKFNMKSQRRKYTIDTYFETIQLLTQYNDLYNMLFESAYLSDIYLEKLTKSSFAQSNMFLKLYKMEYVDKATIAECEKFIPNDVAVEEDTSTSSGVLDYNDKNKFSQLFIDDHRKTILRDVLVCQITHRNCLISVLSHIYEYEQYFLSTKVNENQVPEKILIQNYCENLQNNIEHYSLRSQLFAVYNSLYLLVKKFPEIAKKYFIFSANLNLSSDITSQSKKSPKNKKKMFYFPKDSKEDLLINIFFIPTNSDIISFYKSPLVKLSENENGGNTSEQDEKNDADSNDTSDEKKKDKIENTYIGRDVLEKHILLITTLNDILNYFYGLVDLGYIEKRNGLMYSSQLTDEKITADWGGIETIYVLMDNLKSDMATIQSNYLKTQLKYAMVRRDYIIYNIDVIIDNYLLNKFLSKGQFKIFKKLKEHSKFPLLNLSNFPQSGIQAVNFSLPSLYRFSKDNFKKHSISELFPNLSYANCQGLYPLQILPHTNISKNLHSILSCLNTLERKIAHAEFIGVSLLQSEAYVQHQSDKVKVTRSCDKTIEKYSFLSLLIEKWKLVKIHRNMWIKRKIKNFNVTHKDISEGVYAYNWEIVIPIYQSIARKNGFLEWSNKIQNIQSNVIDAIPYPPGVSILETVEIEIDNLNGLYQCSMINDVRKKIASDLNFVISEKSHEESNLPIHLWKKSGFEEPVDIVRNETEKIVEIAYKLLRK